MSQENSADESGYDRGFRIRMGVLSTIMVVLAAVFALDRFVIIPAADNVIEKMDSASFAPGTDHKQQIREIAGKEPFSTRKIYVYELESYRFNRILPFLDPRLVDVVYADDRFVEAIPGGFPESDLHRLEQPVQNPGSTGGPPGISTIDTSENSVPEQPGNRPVQNHDDDDGNVD